MRMHALDLAGAVVAAAIPLSPEAQPMQENRETVASAEQTTSAPEACPPGWVWEDAGYLGGGTWRPAHCASLRGTIDF
jgi:hypothetical protein